jgi:hypothetical protein
LLCGARTHHVKCGIDNGLLLNVAYNENMQTEIPPERDAVRASRHDEPGMTELEAAIHRLGSRDGTRSEASIQSDIRLVLLLADLGLEDHDLAVDLEVPAAGGRIDILVGRTVIEVKRDLTKPGVPEAALVEAGLLPRLDAAVRKLFLSTGDPV